MEIINGNKEKPTAVDIVAKHLGIKRRFGHFFSDLRKGGTTYKEIENALDISEGLYKAWEQGFRLPDFETAMRVSGFFGQDALVDLALLFSEIQKESQLYREEINTPIIC